MKSYFDLSDSEKIKILKAAARESNRLQKESAKKMKIIEKKYGKDFGTNDLKKVAKWISKMGYKSIAKFLLDTKHEKNNT